MRAGALWLAGVGARAVEYRCEYTPALAPSHQAKEPPAKSEVIFEQTLTFGHRRDLSRVLDL